MYTELITSKKTYKLRLNTRNVIMLEKEIGCNPLSIFGDEGSIPTTTTMVKVLHASLQALEHGITLDDAYDIFDDYIADGHQYVDFINVILDIYKVSGLIRNDNPKNVKAGETE